MGDLDSVTEIIAKPHLLEEIRDSFASSSARSALVPVDYLAEPISYLDFFGEFLVPNRPCVFGPWLTSDWKCRREWVTREGGREDRLDFPALKLLFGEATVPVANCKSRQYDAQTKTEWKFADYLAYLEGYGHKSDEVLYCKDWHFCRDFPDHKPYDTPVFFASDWLNQYWDGLDNDDYRFIYIGPSSSWTPFHADVLRSFSWSCNIFGAKHWLLFARGAEEELRDSRGRLPFDVRDVSGAKGMSVSQRCGETIFVPSGWHHQVHNGTEMTRDQSFATSSTPTISVNHNWLNGCNVDLGWRHLRKCLDDVKNAISDCSDMEGFEGQCQLILKANEGMDFNDFLDFLLFIATPILDKLRHLAPGDVEEISTDAESREAFRPGSRLHDSFDLSRILHCLKLMDTDEDFQRALSDSLKRELFSDFISRLESVLEKGSTF